MLATKHDIEIVRKDLLEVEKRLDAKMDAKIHSAKADIIKWMAGLMIV